MTDVAEGGTAARRAALRELADKWQIHQTTIRLCHGLDQVDEEIVAATFHPEAEATVTARDEEIVLRGAARVTSALLARAPADPGAFVAHRSFNPRIELQGDRAVCETYRTAFVGLLDPVTGRGRAQHTFGRCTDLFERRAGIWRILRHHVEELWVHRPVDGGSWPRRAESRRDRSDPSYHLFDEVETAGADSPGADSPGADSPGAGDPDRDRDDGAEETALRDAVDGWLVYETVVRYCRGVDRFDEDLLAAVFHPDSTTAKVWSAAEPDVVILDGADIAAITIAKAREAYTDTFTLHSVTTPLIEIRGDFASSQNWSGASRGLTRCLDLFERRDGRWRVRRRRVLGGWSQPGPAGGRRIDAADSRQDRSDPSYRFLAWPSRPAVAETAGESDADLVADKWQVFETVVRTWHSIDRGEERLLASAFHPDASLTTRTCADGPVDVHGTEVAAALLRHLGQGVTLHLAMNPWIEVRGDRAACETHLTVLVVPRQLDDTAVVHQSLGRCLDLFERRDGSWRILRRQIIPGWYEPHPVLHRPN
ncbi:nuclear transport factor 2 family protein [Frankia sp. QA3]|uniref:nuclear transport factor 2 family protein n=1 Tax=Frankia sp. QA3 TaxID=710111 RepID=UPI000269BB64|nr:nuclear transport factor 2 family protein [Frankia sp. QA3]EIV92619.1 hypothetical protein FraQA3DRAFT_2210 [Frankia sp. QA3]